MARRKLLAALGVVAVLALPGAPVLATGHGAQDNGGHHGGAQLGDGGHHGRMDHGHDQRSDLHHQSRGRHRGTGGVTTQPRHGDDATPQATETPEPRHGHGDDATPEPRHGHGDDATPQATETPDANDDSQATPTPTAS